MWGALKRNSTISQLLQPRKGWRTDVFADSVSGTRQNLVREHLQTRDYFKFSQYFRRSTNGVSPPPSSSLFSSALFSSSSSGVASLGKVGFVVWYLEMVKARPMLTKSVTCSLIYIAADLSSQIIASSTSFDLVRTLRMAGYGMIVLGPSLHFWFNFVSKLFPKQDLISTFKKMAMAQTLYGPFMTVIFLSLNAYMQGENGQEILARLKRDLLPTMVNGVMYWPVCDFITYKFVPVQLQPLVSNSFSYLWTIYMTYMASLEKAGSTPC